MATELIIGVRRPWICGTSRHFISHRLRQRILESARSTTNNLGPNVVQRIRVKRGRTRRLTLDAALTVLTASPTLVAKLAVLAAYGGYDNDQQGE
jgi:hypothetical protein